MQQAGLTKTELAEMLEVSLPTLRRRIAESGLCQALPKLSRRNPVIYGPDVAVIEQHFGRNRHLRHHFNLN